MTDRIRTLKVLLDRDIRTDDLEFVTNAIKMIKGVQRVEDGDVVGIDEHMARDTALREFIIMHMEFLSISLVMGDQQETYNEIRRLLAESYRRKTGRSLFG